VSYSAKGSHIESLADGPASAANGTEAVVCHYPDYRERRQPERRPSGY
jgi:protein tyrosine phosphatase (PTP) superfamily phosphohydrolase (DUF442 family)